MSVALWAMAVLVVVAAYLVGRAYDETLTPTFNWSVRTWRRLRMLAIVAIIYSGLVSGRPTLQAFAFAALAFLGLWIALRLRPTERIDTTS